MTSTLNDPAGRPAQEAAVLHRRAKEIFLAVAEGAEAEREDVLRRAVGDDEALRRAVEALLAADVGDELRAPVAECLVSAQSPPHQADRPQGPLGLPDELHRQYEAIEPLGQGGMGTVYLARHRLLEERRVIKGLRAELLASPAARERFLREARLAARVKHPGVARIHDFTISPEGHGWIVMEHCPGVDLETRVKRDGPLPAATVVDIAAQALTALGHLHSLGVVHRDVSTDNLMVAEQGDGTIQVKLLDLGIATSVDEDPQQMTQEGAFVGKLAYAPPERIKGVARSDPRSDLYALGVVLFRLLTARFPIDGRNTGEILSAHLHSAPEALPEVDVAGADLHPLAALIGRLLSKDPDERPADAEAALVELRRAGAGPAEGFHPERATVSLATPTRRFLVHPRLSFGTPSLRGLVLAITVALATSALSLTSPVETLDARWRELGLSMAPPLPPDPRLVFITVEDETLADDPRPMSERAGELARIIEGSLAVGAVGVAVDYLLPVAWAGDRAFGRAVVTAADRLVLAAAAAPGGRIVGQESLGGPVVLALGRERATRIFGLANLEVDLDGVVRRAPTEFLTDDGRVLPGFALRAARLLAPALESIAHTSEVSIDFRPDWRRWPRLSWDEALAGGGGDLLADRLVVIGDRLSVSGDVFTVPHPRGMPRQIPGVFLQGLAIATLLDPSSRAESSPWIGILLCTLLASLGILWPRSDGFGWALVGGLALGVAGLALAPFAIQLPVLSPILALTLTLWLRRI